MQRETQSHYNDQDSFCYIVPAEQCKPSKKRRHHTVAQVHPIRPGRTTLGDGKPPAGTSEKGHYGGSVHQLSICHVRVEGLCDSHQERGRDEWNKSRETKVQSRFWSLSDGPQTEALVGVSSIR